MNHRKSAMGRSRDFGIPTGPGKGDKSRVTDQTAYAQNFDEIDWGRPREDRSKPNPDWKNAHPFIENEAEWQHIPDNPPHRDEPCCASITNDIIRE